MGIAHQEVGRRDWPRAKWGVECKSAAPHFAPHLASHAPRREMGSRKVECKVQPKLTAEMCTREIWPYKQRTPRPYF